tara:strand:- start:775 stop:1023 length:249 start_codon:yes stop_codon:yes gene_type:complete
MKITYNKKDYTLKQINVDKRFEILDLIAGEGDSPRPSVLLTILRNSVELADEQIEQMSALEIGELTGEVVKYLTEGKKKSMK